MAGPRSPMDDIPEDVVRRAKEELDAESRPPVDRLAGAACVVLSWLAGEALKTMAAAKGKR